MKTLSLSGSVELNYEVIRLVSANRSSVQKAGCEYQTWEGGVDNIFKRDTQIKILLTGSYFAFHSSSKKIIWYHDQQVSIWLSLSWRGSTCSWSINLSLSTSAAWKLAQNIKISATKYQQQHQNKSTSIKISATASASKYQQHEHEECNIILSTLFRVSRFLLFVCFSRIH